MKTNVAVARVQLTVEVDAGTWGETCSIGQLYDQAAKEGRDKVIKMIVDAVDRSGVRIIGEPKVVGVITEQK